MRPVVMAGTLTAAILVWSALVVAEAWIDRRSDRAGLDALQAKVEIAIQPALWGHTR